MDFVVEQVPVHQVLDLRQRVLRPHQRRDEVGFPGDDAGTHFAAFEPAGRVIGVASVMPEIDPESLEPSWRLRGMACLEEVRGQGAGRAILLAVLDHVARQNGDRCWCMARLSAVGFYERTGFERVGAEFEEPIIGPHVQMRRAVTPADLRPAEE